MRELENGYEIDDSLARFDFERCHCWLTGAYWSPGIGRDEVERGFRNSSLVVGAYRRSEQVGCLRVVSDLTRFAYFLDVFVAPECRSRGIGRAMVERTLEHPKLAPVYKWTLATLDGHEFYRSLGFRELVNAERWMSLERPRPWL